MASWPSKRTPSQQQLVIAVPQDLFAELAKITMREKTGAKR